MKEKTIHTNKTLCIVNTYLFRIDVLPTGANGILSIKATKFANNRPISSKIKGWQS